MYSNISTEFTSIDDLPDFIEDFFDDLPDLKDQPALQIKRGSSISTACSSISCDFDDSLLFRKPRPCKQVTGLVRILKRFTRVGKTCPVKTQNFLSQLSRSFARMFSDCKKMIKGTKNIIDVMSSRGLYKFSIANIEKMNTAKSLFAEYFVNIKQINTIFESENQPQKNGYKSRQHGIEYLAWILNHKTMRSFWALYLDLIFEGTPLPDLCGKFGMQCCATLEHKEDCLDKWASLREYLHKDIMFDLQVEDFMNTKQNLLM